MPHPVHTPNSIVARTRNIWFANPTAAISELPKDPIITLSIAFSIVFIKFWNATGRDSVINVLKKRLSSASERNICSSVY